MKEEIFKPKQITATRNPQLILDWTNRVSEVYNANFLEEYFPSGPRTLTVLRDMRQPKEQAVSDLILMFKSLRDVMRDHTRLLLVAEVVFDSAVKAIRKESWFSRILRRNPTAKGYLTVPADLVADLSGPPPSMLKSINLEMLLSLRVIVTELEQVMFSVEEHASTVNVPEGTLRQVDIWIKALGKANSSIHACIDSAVALCGHEVKIHYQGLENE